MGKLEEKRKGKETGKGKTDFAFRWLVKEVPSPELRDMMRRGMLLELWESRPLIIERK